MTGLKLRNHSAARTTEQMTKARSPTLIGVSEN